MPKKLNITLKDENAIWLAFAAALAGESMNSYVNLTLERDREGADENTREAYAAFLVARGDSEGKVE